MASQTMGTESYQLQLLAADRYITSNKTSLAQPILNSLAEVALPPELFCTHQLLQAQIYVNKNQSSSALRVLNALKNSQSLMTQQQRQQQLALTAKALQEHGNLVASIETRSQLLKIEPSDQRKQTLTAIWLSMQSVPASTISALDDINLSRNVQGWVDLNTIINAHHSANELTTELALWQRRFPNHAASALLPRTLEAAPAKHPEHIALLLPLTGQYAANAQAVRNGFFTAYYYDKQHTNQTPSIRLIDTAAMPVDDAYQQAVQSGADFIVGPLTKNNLAMLIQSKRLSVPTLALNALPNTKSIKNLYEFGLSPIDELDQLSQKAIRAQHHNALIIAPNNSWGQNISKNLSQQWQQQGGVVVDTLNYSSRNSLSPELKHLLRIQDSYSRGYAIRSILGTKDVRIVSRRRQDFDAIFLIAQPDMARQIKPLLRFYFAGNVPVYGLSQLYDGSPNPNKDRDLNDIVFCDMPWVLESQHMHPTYLNTLQKQSQQVWPQSYKKYSKLYALGIDAYRVSQSLNTMQLLPDFGLRAATGTLYLDNNQIYRQLIWAQFDQGKPRLTR